MTVRLMSCVMAMSLIAATPVEATDHSERIRQVLGSQVEFEKAREAGKKAAFFCVHCHGEEGISAYAHIPNLAGQNAHYLLNQIEKFADGRRQDEFMSGLIKVLKPEDRFNMAIYYSSLPVRAMAVKDPALAAKGKQLYDRRCSSCHGPQGHGNEKIARLAGQQPVYLKVSLEQYRKGTKLRNDPVMGGIARRLNDEDIAAVVAYLPTMP